MALFNFESVRKLLQSAEDRLSDIRGQLIDLQKQRDKVRYAPAAKADVQDNLTTWTTEAGKEGEYAVQLRAALERYARSPTGGANHKNLKDLLTLNADVLDQRQIGHAVFELLGPQIRARQMEIINSVAWPDGALSEPERRQQLADLDRQISKLQAEQNDLLESAQAAGLKLE